MPKFANFILIGLVLATVTKRVLSQSYYGDYYSDNYYSDDYDDDYYGDEYYEDDYYNDDYSSDSDEYYEDDYYNDDYSSDSDEDGPQGRSIIAGAVGTVGNLLTGVFGTESLNTNYYGPAGQNLPPGAPGYGYGGRPAYYNPPPPYHNK